MQTYKLNISEKSPSTKEIVFNANKFEEHFIIKSDDDFDYLILHLRNNEQSLKRNFYKTDLDKIFNKGRFDALSIAKNKEILKKPIKIIIKIL